MTMQIVVPLSQRTPVYAAILNAATENVIAPGSAGTATGLTPADATTAAADFQRMSVLDNQQSVD